MANPHEPSSPSAVSPIPMRVLLLAIMSVSLAFATFLWLLARGSFGGSTDTVRLLTAIIGVAGVMTTALLSLVGVLLKNSIDLRAEARGRTESERNAILQREAEGRLRLEAAIRAVQLLANPSG